MKFYRIIFNKPFIKINKIIFITIVLFIFFLLKIVWLGLILSTLLTFYFIISNNCFKIFLLTKYPVFKTLFYFFGIITLSILLRVFVFDIFKIPTESMENTFISGDRILLSKLNYGPKLPRTLTEIPILNFFFSNNNNENSRKQWNFRRMNGLKKVEREDIVVYKNEYIDAFMVKRCIGLPGDIIEIRDSRVIINKQLLKNKETYLFTYEVWKKKTITLDEILLKIKYNKNIVYLKNRTAQCIELTLTISEALEIVSLVDSIKIKIVNTKGNLFPYNNKINWSIDNFGPLIIPYNGMRLVLNEYNFIVYNQLLLREGVVKKGDLFFLNNKIINEYYIKENYFFMMGDNRHNSIDSRYFGFVSENNIEGEVFCKLF